MKRVSRSAYIICALWLLPIYAGADLTLEVAKAVKKSPPGNPTKYPVEVHIITTGICTFDLADGKIVVPRHDTMQGSIPAHHAYLTFEESYLDPKITSTGVKSGAVKTKQADPYTGNDHAVYDFNNDEIGIAATFSPDGSVATYPPKGRACPDDSRVDLSMHWVPSPSVAIGIPTAVKPGFLGADPDNDKVAATFILAPTGQLHAHVLDERLYEFRDAAIGSDLVQSVAQIVDYTFLISGPLHLTRRKFKAAASSMEADFIVLNDKGTGSIYVKLGNTPDHFIPMPMPKVPAKDDHFTLHYDMLLNPAARPVPMEIGTCSATYRALCLQPVCTMYQGTDPAPLVNAAADAKDKAIVGSGRIGAGGASGRAVVKKLSPGGLDCGPDSLP